MTVTLGRLAAAALALTAATLGLSTSGCSNQADTFEVADASTDSGTPADFRYVIPAGTGEALDGGAEIEIVPADLEVRVGQELELVNDDDRGHTVGPFFVGAGETVRQKFTAPGTFVGICTVHPSGQVVVTVTE